MDRAAVGPQLAPGQAQPPGGAGGGQLRHSRGEPRHTRLAVQPGEGRVVEPEGLLRPVLELLGMDRPSYQDAIKATYTAKGSYLAFLNRLQKVEEEVIQAAISTMRKGTKKERRLWFDKVRAATKKNRMEAGDRIYGE